MKKPASKLLVIDACVLRSAGETVHPVSSACRTVLNAIYTICHRAVVTDAIKLEWNKHQSKFSKQWRGAMARRGKIIDTSVAPDAALRTNITSSEISDKDKQAALKDIHLIEAARATDHIIISQEKNSRIVFRDLPQKNAQRKLQKICWANPVDDSSIIDWLEKGALRKEQFPL